MIKVSSSRTHRPHVVSDVVFDILPKHVAEEEADSPHPARRITEDIARPNPFLPY